MLIANQMRIDTFKAPRGSELEGSMAIDISNCQGLWFVSESHAQDPCFCTCISTREHISRMTSANAYIASCLQYYTGWFRSKDLHFVQAELYRWSQFVHLQRLTTKLSFLQPWWSSILVKIDWLIPTALRIEYKRHPPLTWCCAACMYHHWENWWFSNDIPLESVWSLDLCLTPILNNTWYLTEHWKIKHLVSLCDCLPVIKYYIMHLSSSICNPCALTKLVIVSETGAETFKLLFLHRQHLPNESCPLRNTNGWSLRGTLWWPCRNWSFLTLGKTSAASTSNVPDIIGPIFFEASSLFVDFEIPGKEKEGIGHCCIKLIQNMRKQTAPCATTCKQTAPLRLVLGS